MEKIHLVKLVLYATVVGSVFVIFILKGVLLLTRYIITATTWDQCHVESNGSEVASSVNHEYIFTIIVYSIASLLRILEYLILGLQLYYFLFKQDRDSLRQFFSSWNLKSCRWLTLYLAILSPYFILGLFIIPGLGIYQELQHNTHCHQHYRPIYIAYCVVNMFRYASAGAVRIMMIYCATVLKRMWFPDGAPQHTSLGLMHRDKSCITDIPLTALNGQSEPDVLQDWKEVSSDWKERCDEYAEIGNKAQAVHKIFQTWFIVPWVIYLLASSLKTYNILRPWSADGDGSTPPADIPQIYYLAYNLNQLITLIVPFLCAKKINTYHKKYFKVMRNKQLIKFEDSSSRLSFARQLVPVGSQPTEEYDFIPRIIGTNIEIPIGSPMYIIVLLTGIFLSVSESLLSNN